MQTENNIKPISPFFFRSDLTQFNQNRETFHDIFQSSLIEVTVKGFLDNEESLFEVEKNS